MQPRISECVLKSYEFHAIRQGAARFMTRRLGGGFFEGVELGKEFGRIFVEGAEATFAAETEKTFAVKGIHGIVEFIVRNKADLERVRGREGLGLGFFLGGLGEDRLQGRWIRFFLLGLEQPKSHGHR